MLAELRVRNIALIEEASLSFGAGLNVLTGETGAGKTALLAALKLLIGERADASFVRDGASELRAEAIFSQQSNTEEYSEHLATRRISKDGRSRCMLDDEMVTVKALSQKLGPLVDLCGQHEHQSLLRADAQRDSVDMFGGAKLVAARAVYQDAFKAYRAAQAHFDDFEARAQTSALEREQASFVLREIAAVDPQVGEYEEWESQLPRLRNGEELAQAGDVVYQALRAEEGVLALLVSAQQELTRTRAIDPALEDIAVQLDELLIVADDLADQLRSYRDGIEFDPAALDIALQRLGELEGLRKRFGPRMEDVFAVWEDAECLVGGVEDIQARRESACAEVEKTRIAVKEAAVLLAELRAQHGTAFAQELTEAVQGLAMSGAVFSLDIQPLDFDAWTLQGSCRYELKYQPTPTSIPRSLAKIASGGELSRVMLAYKTVLHDIASPVVLVFDEIDAGVGGETATAIAQRLADLAREHQVIVVTHLAQIAALADTHWIVEKTNNGTQVSTQITQVEGASRVDEIARMLAGVRDELSRAHARSLLGDRL